MEPGTTLGETPPEDTSTPVKLKVQHKARMEPGTTLGETPPEDTSTLVKLEVQP